MSEAIQKVGADTEALKSLEKDMSAVAKQTADIKKMDQRMANIEEAMPTLVEVQQHLARVPDTLENLNENMEQLTQLLDRLLQSLEGLNGGGRVPPGGPGPARPAGRPPAGRRTSSAAADPLRVGTPNGGVHRGEGLVVADRPAQASVHRGREERAQLGVPGRPARDRDLVARGARRSRRWPAPRLRARP